MIIFFKWTLLEPNWETVKNIFLRLPQTVTTVSLRLIAPELLALIGSLITLIVCTSFPTDPTSTTTNTNKESNTNARIPTTPLS